MELTESDFETVLDPETDEWLPLIRLDNTADFDYYIMYGEVEEDEILDYCRNYLEWLGEDDADSLLRGSEVTYHFAVAFEDLSSRTGFSLKWRNVDPDMDGSFPITIVSVW